MLRSIATTTTEQRPTISIVKASLFSMKCTYLRWLIDALSNEMLIAKTKSISSGSRKQQDQSVYFTGHTNSYRIMVKCACLVVTDRYCSTRSQATVYSFAFGNITYFPRNGCRLSENEWDLNRVTNCSRFVLFHVND